MACGKMALVNQEKSRHCTPCKTDKKEVISYIYCMDCEAYFCDDCFKFHKKVPHLAKHIILRKKEIDIWTKIPYKCKTHDRCFEFFCEEHSDLCCQVCVSLQHRSCERMKYLQENAGNQDSSKKNKKLVRKVDKQMDAVLSRMEKLEQKTELNETSKVRAEECVNQFRSRMNVMLDNFEIQANEAIHVRYSNNKESLDQMVVSFEKMKRDLEDLKQQLTSQTSDKIVLAFISLKMGQKQVNDAELTLSKLKTALPPMKFRYRLDPAIERFFQNIDSIGGVEDEYARNVALSSESTDGSASGNWNQIVNGSDALVTNEHSIAMNQSTVPNQQSLHMPKQRRRRRIQSFADAVIDGGTNLTGSHDGNAAEDSQDETKKDEVDNSNDDDQNDENDDGDDIDNNDDTGSSSSNNDDDNDDVYHFNNMPDVRDWKVKPRKGSHKYICSNRFCSAVTDNKYCPSCGSECKERGYKTRR